MLSIEVALIGRVDDHRSLGEAALHQRRAYPSHRIVDHLGWTEMIFNHITAKVPGPEEHFLINPFNDRTLIHLTSRVPPAIRKQRRIVNSIITALDAGLSAAG